MTQVVARVDDELISAVDELIDGGHFRSRSDAIRLGLEVVVDQQRRQAVGAAIVDGYRRQPQEDDDLWSDEATIAMISEEPW